MARHVVYESHESNVERNLKGALFMGVFFIIVGLLSFLGGSKFYGYGGIIIGIFTLLSWLVAKGLRKLGM
ncbi:MAG: hypothetical protein ABH849_02635 [Nanoarchaeota archaeon]